MTNRLAIASGNWSAPATWTGGIIPLPGDDVFANGKTVTIDVSVNVASLNNPASGTFNVGNGITVAANIVAGQSNCVVVSGAAGNTTFIVGNVMGSQTNNAARGLTNNSLGTVTVTGNVTGGAFSTAYGIQHVGAGTLNVNGACIGGAGSHAVNATAGSGTLNVNGTPVGGSAGQASGVSVAGAGAVNVTGNPTGGTGTNNRGINITGSGPVVITGSCFGNEGPGILHTGSSTVLVTGDAIGGGGSSVPNAVGVLNSGTGQITIQGFAIGAGTGASIAPGVSSVGTLPVIIGGSRFSATACSPINGAVLRASLVGASLEVRDSFLAPIILS